MPISNQRFPDIDEGQETYLPGLLTRLAQICRPRLGIPLILESALFWLVVRFVYLLMVSLGLAALARGTVIVFCGFGCLCLCLRRLLGRILSLRKTIVGCSVIRDR
jgi:hypothetical protein